MLEIDGILKELVARKGSDLHLKVGRPPLMRIAGELLPTEFAPVTQAGMQALSEQLLGPERYRKLLVDREVDASYEIHQLARFRLNVFHQMEQLGAVMRLIPLEVPTIDGLGLPPVLKDLTSRPQGLILVTGPTGSGKSTTLAAMIQHINETCHKHIITIEDPVEFVQPDRKSTINRRELGTDTRSLGEALRRALRQDPDIILIGEMRDRETMETALLAAETGHLVFSTLHTNDAKQTVDRIIDSFPPDQIQQIRSALSLALEGVISQRLVRRADGTGRACAMEIMINSPQIRELIETGKTADIEKAMMKAGAYYRMQTFNQALSQLVEDHVITAEEAMAKSNTPENLRLLLRGVASSSTGQFTVSELNPGASKPEEEKKSQEDSGTRRTRITRGFSFGQ